jgi:hypothetical protein
LNGGNAAAYKVPAAKQMSSSSANLRCLPSFWISGCIFNLSASYKDNIYIKYPAGIIFSRKKVRKKFIFLLKQ